MAAALLFSYAIEFSQLYQAEWINALRHTALGGLVLGFCGVILSAIPWGFWRAG